MVPRAALVAVRQADLVCTTNVRTAPTPPFKAKPASGKATERTRAKFHWTILYKNLETMCPLLIASYLEIHRAVPNRVFLECQFFE